MGIYTEDEKNGVEVKDKNKRCSSCNYLMREDKCGNPCCVAYDESLDDPSEGFVGPLMAIKETVNMNIRRLRNIEKNIRGLKKRFWI